MFGPSTGKLNVLIAGQPQALWTKRYKKRKFSNLKNIKSVFFYSGDLGNRWRYGHVTVQSDNPYQMAFEGIVGTTSEVRKKKRIHEVY